jgi:hypothetical protein
VDNLGMNFNRAIDQLGAGLSQANDDRTSILVIL